MVYVGEFNEAQVAANVDFKELGKKKEETGLKFTKTETVKDGNTPVAIKVWLLTDKEYYNGNMG